MKASTRSSNIRAMLADDDAVRQTVKEMVKTMGSIKKEHTRGFLCASLLDPNQPELIDESMAKPIQLDEQEYQSLCKLINDENELFVLPCQALSVQTISIRSVSYSTSDSRDCNIMFQPRDHPATIQFQKAGVIQTIFQHSST
jgi:hypothetical protein